MPGQEDDVSPSLEEQVQALQEQRLEPKQIVEKILDEDMTVNVGKLSELTGMNSMDIGRIKGRLSRLHKRAAEKGANQQAESDGSEASEGSPYKEGNDATAILRKILMSHPDLPPRVVPEVLSWAEFGPIEPRDVASLLQSFKGVTVQVANMLATKYSLAVQKAQSDGSMQQPLFLVTPSVHNQPRGGFSMVGRQTGTGYFQDGQGGFPAGQGQGGFSLGQPQGQLGGYGQGQPDLRSMIREELQRVLEDRKPRESQPATELYVDIDEPVRSPEGSVIVDANEKPIMKHMRVPASQAAIFMPKEDTESRVLERLARYKDLFGGDMSPEKIREIIRQEMPVQNTPQEKPITIADVNNAATKAAEETASKIMTSKAAEERTDRRFAELGDRIERVGSARAIEGYREDSARLLGQGVDGVVRLAESRRPIEVLVKDGGRLLFGIPTDAAPKEFETGAGAGLIDRIRNREWITPR